MLQSITDMNDTISRTRAGTEESLDNPAPVQAWQTDSAPDSIALRFAARYPADAPGVYSFVFDTEQARQLIRDLSSAVLVSDLKRVR